MSEVCSVSEHVSPGPEAGWIAGHTTTSGSSTTRRPPGRPPRRPLQQGLSDVRLPPVPGGASTRACHGLRDPASGRPAPPGWLPSPGLRCRFPPLRVVLRVLAGRDKPAAERFAVNQFCLVDDAAEAFRLAVRFSREEGAEPGPYDIGGGLAAGEWDLVASPIGGSSWRRSRTGRGSSWRSSTCAAAAHAGPAELDHGQVSPGDAALRPPDDRQVGGALLPVEQIGHFTASPLIRFIA